MTDHRINQSFSDLEGILSGQGKSVPHGKLTTGLEYIIDELQQDFARRRLDSLLDGDEDLDE